jgi:hypothetical protein
MKQFFCPVCKAPIVCSFRRPDLYFYQDENDNVVRDTNEDLIHGIKSYCHFHCSDDMEDDIKALDNLTEFIEWKKEFNASILIILLKEDYV